MEARLGQRERLSSKRRGSYHSEKEQGMIEFTQENWQAIME
jgi:hypothetical protein